MSQASIDKRRLAELCAHCGRVPVRRFWNCAACRITRSQQAHARHTEARRLARNAYWRAWYHQRKKAA